jgi:endogenous inhibitor of DNA gyrase (YacG/DUF329 family)
LSVITCPECGQSEDSLIFEWVKISDGRRQIKVSCPDCNRWIKWAPQVEPYITYADRKRADE